MYLKFTPYINMLKQVIYCIVAILFLQSSMAQKILRPIWTNPFVGRYSEFSPDGNFVLTGSKDSTARIWDSRTGDRLAVIGKYNGAVNTTQFSVTGDTVLVSDDYGEVYMYSVSGLHPSAIESEGTKGNDTDINVVYETMYSESSSTKRYRKQYHIPLPIIWVMK